MPSSPLPRWGPDGEPDKVPDKAPSPVSRHSMIVHAPVQEVFGFLADPRNRPQWQSSLKAIEPADPDDPRVGTRWIDVTWVGLRPLMEITRMEPYRLWQERGRWHGVEAVLTLRFTGVPEGARVVAETTVSGRGLARLAALAASRLAPLAVGADLRRAAALLEES